MKYEIAKEIILARRIGIIAILDTIIPVGGVMYVWVLLVPAMASYGGGWALGGLLTAFVALAAAAAYIVTTTIHSVLDFTERDTE